MKNMNLEDIREIPDYWSLSHFKHPELMEVERITISSSTRIGRMAFYAFQNLEEVVFVQKANTFPVIGAGAFACCPSLRSVNIPQGVQRLEEGVFFYCPNLQSLSLPESLEGWEQGTFSWTGLESFFSPPKVKRLAPNSFAHSALRSVHLNANTAVGERAFYNCSALESIDVEKPPVTVEKEAFARCHSLKIPRSSFKNVGRGAFRGVAHI